MSVTYQVQVLRSEDARDSKFRFLWSQSRTPSNKQCVELSEESCDRIRKAVPDRVIRHGGFPNWIIVNSSIPVPRGKMIPLNIVIKESRYQLIKVIEYDERTSRNVKKEIHARAEFPLRINKQACSEMLTYCDTVAGIRIPEQHAIHLIGRDMLELLN